MIDMMDVVQMWECGRKAMETEDANISKGQVGRNGWDEVMWLWRTSENTGECLG